MVPDGTRNTPTRTNTTTSFGKPKKGFITALHNGQSRQERVLMLSNVPCRHTGSRANTPSLFPGRWNFFSDDRRQLPV